MQPIASNKAVLSVFEKYQKERLAFVQTVADFASREVNIDALQAAGVMALLRPLLLDSVPAIQLAAALALGRLANYSKELAENVVDSEIIPTLVHSLVEQNASAFVLRAVAKHSPELALSVVNGGALTSLVSCLEEFDPGVKESASWALGYIARHNGGILITIADNSNKLELSQAVVDAGAIPLLVLCVQEPEIALKRIAASALSDVARHSPELAQAVVDANAVTFLAPLLANPDAKLRRQVCSALSQIAKHTVDLAETVVDAEIFPNVLLCVKDKDGCVRKNGATLISEIAKHSPELAQLIVNSGGLVAVVDYVKESRGNARLPGIITLGFIAAFSETLALAVILSKGVQPVADALETEGEEEHVKAACAWALGQIGRHSPDHAKTLAAHAVLPKLLKVLNSNSGETDEAGADLKVKTKRALKSILEKTLEMEALEPLLHKTTPENVLKYVMCQFAKILPLNTVARRNFVTCGALQKLQEIASTLKSQDGWVGSKLADYVRVINECFPEELVRYYSPGYSAILLDKIDDYNMKSHPVAQQRSALASGESGAPSTLAV